MIRTLFTKYAVFKNWKLPTYVTLYFIMPNATLSRYIITTRVRKTSAMQCIRSYIGCFTSTYINICTTGSAPSMAVQTFNHFINY